MNETMCDEILHMHAMNHFIYLWIETSCFLTWFCLAIDKK